jgi:hypothetical protein
LVCGEPRPPLPSRIDYYSYHLLQFASGLEHLHFEPGQKLGEFLFGN